jgi:hypothetical protein
MSYIRTVKDRYKAHDPVRGDDMGTLALNSEYLYERPRTLFLGPRPKKVSLTADGYPDAYYRSFPYVDGTDFNLDWGSFMVHRPEADLEVSLLFIATWMVEDFVARDFDALREARGTARYQVKATIRQMAEGEGSFKSASNPKLDLVSNPNVTFFPTDKSGLSRFLLQARHSRFNGKGKTAGFTYREGQLYQEDFALLNSVRLQGKLPSTFNVNRPVRMDLEVDLNTTSIRYGNPGIAQPSEVTSSRIRLYLIGCSVTGRGVLP